MTSIPPAILVQIWYPFNNPPPTFPSDMPYPLLFIMIGVSAVAFFLDGDDAKAKAK